MKPAHWKQSLFWPTSSAAASDGRNKEDTQTGEIVCRMYWFLCGSFYVPLPRPQSGNKEQTTKRKLKLPPWLDSRQNSISWVMSIQYLSNHIKEDSNNTFPTTYASIKYCIKSTCIHLIMLFNAPLCCVTTNKTLTLAKLVCLWSLA